MSQPHPLRRLLAQGSIYTLGSALQLSASAITLPVITRLLGPGDYGIVTLALLVNILGVTVAGLGLPAAITRLFFDERGGSASAKQLIVSTVPLAAAVVLAVAVSSPLWAGGISNGHSTEILLGVLLAFPGAIGGAVVALLLAQERPLAFITVALVGSVGAQLLGIGALLLGPRDPQSYLLGFGAAWIGGALAGLLLTRAYRARPASLAALRHGLAIGLPTVPHLLSVYILALGDRVVIEAIDGVDAVGRYSVAYAVGSIVLILLSALQNAWVPITFSLQREERWPALAETTSAVVRIAALLCGVLALSAPVALDLLAPSDYDPADLVPVVGLVALAGIAWAFYLPNIQVLTWEKRTVPLAWITPLCAVVNLALVAVLLPSLGLEGAALATVAAFVLQAALTAAAAARLAQIPWDWRGLASSALLGIVLVGLALLVPNDGLRLGMALLAGGALGLAISRAVRLQQRTEGLDQASPAATV